ncbi:MAG: proline--tRNA ligase [Thermoprotei archaeon]|nr:MAG: proline--tRNA ligase [Thermoprotei archaeon]
MNEKPPSKYGESFSQWFEWIIREAEIYDYGRYPVKGMGVWLPYGFQIRRGVIELMRRLLNETGHEEILLPLLIPETIFKKESEHVRGFEQQVFWVTMAGNEELDVKLVLRPTSETALSYMESLWIKSYKQLPKKYYQIVSMFRYETKMTKPMIRLREVTTFKEAHTLHETFEDAERQVLEAITIYSEFFDTLGIPYVISRRPQWDKFAGALYTIAFDTVMPDGRVLQIGTVHHLGQTFTKVFEVRIQRRDESIGYAWQTSYGISDRVIACLIAYHSDERGLILPSMVAPFQVVIIPIPAPKDAGKTRVVYEYCSSLLKKLKESGFRVKFDDREDLRPVDKYFEWELRGVPIRIEVGPKEVEEGTVTLFRRDTMSRVTVEKGRVVEVLRKLFEEVDNNLRERAKRWFIEQVKTFNGVDEAVEYIRRNGGIAQIPWCGEEKCAIELENKLGEGIRVLGSPVHTLEKVHIDANSKCPVCGARALTYLRLGRSY